MQLGYCPSPRHRQESALIDATGIRQPRNLPSRSIIESCIIRNRKAGEDDAYDRRKKVHTGIFTAEPHDIKLSNLRINQKPTRTVIPPLLPQGTACNADYHETVCRIYQS